MKKLTTLTILAIALLTGCSKKNVADIKPYESFYTNEISNKKIVFNGVDDKRLLPIVSYIIKKDRVISKFQMNQNIEQWYNDAFKREFHASDIILDQQQRDKKSAIIQINLQDLKVEYFKSVLTEQNLKGVATLEIVIQKNNKVVKKLISTTQSEFKVMIRDAAGFEDFIYSLMSNSVAKSVSIIIDTIKEL